MNQQIDVQGKMGIETWKGTKNYEKNRQKYGQTGVGTLKMGHKGFFKYKKYELRNLWDKKQ